MEHKDEIMVSISCMAFNHERFIAKTLDGFLMQKTNFAFEVLVHDDASKDRTQDIIREYEEKYPDIIKPIYQTENQYSKGVYMDKTFQAPRARGKYIAFCEGDDYWSDPNKLQMQVDYMETHPECQMCVHDTLKVDENGDSIGIYVNGSRKDADYTAGDIIMAGAGNLFQTSSFLCRPVVAFDRPKTYQFPDIGDFPMSIFAGKDAPVHYIGKVMSCYRVNYTGSWTSGVHKSKNQQRVDGVVLRLGELTEIDEDTNLRYHAKIELRRGSYTLTYLRRMKKLPEGAKVLPSVFWMGAYCVYALKEKIRRRIANKR